MRKKASEQYDHLPDQARVELKNSFLKQYLIEIPDDFQVRRHGDQRWLYYETPSDPTYPMHHYCQPLDDQYYLDVQFHYGAHFMEYFPLWQADAEAAEQRIIETDTLTFPNWLSAPSPTNEHS